MILLSFYYYFSTEWIFFQNASLFFISLPKFSHDFTILQFTVVITFDVSTYISQKQTKLKMWDVLQDL